MSYVGLYDDAGSRNSFYIIKDRKISRRKIGFKEFENRNEANFAYRVQSYLAKKDLAPMVYGDVGMIRKHDGELTAHGYLTEVAKPMPLCDDYDCDGECFLTDCTNSITIAKVIDRLGCCGLSYSDAHRGNFGFVRRKKRWTPVVIDVGIESFTDWDEGIYGQCEITYSDTAISGCDCYVCREIRGEI